MLETPQFNRDHNDYDPCNVCLEIINDVFSSEAESLDPEEQVEITEEELDELISAWDEGIENLD